MQGIKQPDTFKTFIRHIKFYSRLKNVLSFLLNVNISAFLCSFQKMCAEKKSLKSFSNVKVFEHFQAKRGWEGKFDRPAAGWHREDTVF